MTRALPTAALLAAAVAVAGCSSSNAAPPPAAPAAQASPMSAHAAPAPAARPRLVFFMNPNGRPCQMQDAILRAMPDLPLRADVVYYKTTEPADLPRFEQYGVRSLPLLVLTDANGVELRRATPGIQADPQVRQLLAP
jgi:thioredoxin 1